MNAALIPAITCAYPISDGRPKQDVAEDNTYISLLLQWTHWPNQHAFNATTYILFLGITREQIANYIALAFHVILHNHDDDMIAGNVRMHAGYVCILRRPKCILLFYVAFFHSHARWLYRELYNFVPHRGLKETLLHFVYIII